jgi:uncharacterized membrane protein YidH (DUF202 family)
MRPSFGQRYTGEMANAMNTQQIQNILILLVGVVMLLASIGTAWVLSRYSRIGAGEREWYAITMMVSIALFLGGVIVCYYGATSFLGG